MSELLLSMNTKEPDIKNAADGRTVSLRILRERGKNVRREAGGLYPFYAGTAFLITEAVLQRNNP